MNASMLYVHTLSALHCGTGQGTGLIDLPIAREGLTSWPVIPGSTIKGMLRQAAAAASIDAKTMQIVFGPDRHDGPDSDESFSAGALWVSAAHLLCFPVRSLKGTVAWVTSPMVLRRWKRAHRAIGRSSPAVTPARQREVAMLLGQQAAETLMLTGTVDGADVSRVVLEDLDLVPEISSRVDVSGIANAIANVAFPGDEVWQQYFVSHFGIVGDAMLTWLMSTTTETRARIRIDGDRKIVSDGQFWFEEAVPADSVFYLTLRAPEFGTALLAAVDPEPNAIFRVVEKSLVRPLQIGGNISVGNGLIRAHVDRSGQEVPV